MWATDMGRDSLGDDIPPDTVNIIKEGKNYGWPYCYGKQIADKTFGGTDTFCKTTEPSLIDLPAHSAPLGLAFSGDDLFVAYHGSWNRTKPTGYKIVRIHNGVPSDFITGWLTSDGALGRPVDILPDNNGNLFISDDKAGVIYKVQPL
jgi:glucose/arabinose dehydrogenase